MELTAKQQEAVDKWEYVMLDEKPDTGTMVGVPGSFKLPELPDTVFDRFIRRESGKVVEYCRGVDMKTGKTFWMKLVPRTTPLNNTRITGA